jgi:uncharacterized damage-inducible protein DinB
VIEAMPPTPDRAARIQRIRQLPALAREAVRGLDAAQLDTPYGPGKWTVRQVVHHLADSHLNAFVRTKLILTEDHPTLKPYDQDAWAGTADGARSDVATSLALLHGLHARWADLLAGLPEEAWARGAHHPESGEVTLDAILRMYADHGEHHLGQIHGLRQEQGW